MVVRGLSGRKLDLKGGGGMKRLEARNKDVLESFPRLGVLPRPKYIAELGLRSGALG